MDVWESHECVGCNSKHIQSAGDTSGTANSQVCHRDDKSKMFNVHTKTQRPQWNSSLFCARAILLVVSIILITIFFFRFRPPPFQFQQSLESGFSGLLACIYSDTTDNGTALSASITAALSSNGRTNMVQWDKYTLALQGQRVLV